MRIEMEDMKCWPDRDAGFFYAVNVFDDAGTRYPVRIMIAGIAIALFKKQANHRGLLLRGRPVSVP
jgi:hypothetical protein